MFVSYTSQQFWTNVWLPKMHNVPNEVDIESSRSPAQSESWNCPNLHCLAVFPTWQYCLYSQVWWIYEINRFRRLSQALVHFVMDRASLITDHENIRSSNSCQVYTFQNNLRAYFWQFSQGFQFFFFEMMVINAWSGHFAELLSRLVCQLTISLHTFLCMTLHIIRPWRNTKILREW